MTVLKTRISWTDSTWNPVVGCTRVTAGCDHCYAAAITKRFFDHPFEQITPHPERLAQARRFKPIRIDSGLNPRMVFVNSMSDLCHEDIDDRFRNQIFDAMEANTSTIFQLLTKRPGVARRFLRSRYGDTGAMPPHLWLGVSVENNDVKKRIDVLREIKHQHSLPCAFLSVEPLIGPIDACDFTGMDWVLIGGESGSGCRPMRIEWLEFAINKARDANAAIWLKQFGHLRNNPAVTEIMKAEAVTMTKAFARAVERGIEKHAEEKGGATLDGKTFRELPSAWHAMREQMNAPAIPSRAKKQHT